jgi:hypothetical protein
VYSSRWVPDYDPKEIFPLSVGPTAATSEALRPGTRNSVRRYVVRLPIFTIYEALFKTKIADRETLWVCVVMPDKFDMRTICISYMSHLLFFTPCIVT